MIKLVLTVFICITGPNVLGQSGKTTDSLISLVSKYNDDSNKVNLYLKIVSASKNKIPQTFKSFLDKAHSLSSKINYLPGKINCLLELSWLTELSGNFDSASRFANMALEISKQYNDTVFIVKSLIKVAWDYTNNLELEKALKTVLEAQAICVKVGDEKQLAECYDKLQFIYFGMKQYHRAIEYGEMTVALAKKINDTVRLYSGLMNLSINYQVLNQSEKSIHLLEEVYAISKAINDRRLELYVYSNLADAYIYLQDDAKLEVIASKALKLSRELGIKNIESWALRDYAILFLHKGKFEIAKRYAIEMHNLNIENKFNFGLKYSFMTLRDISYSMHDYRAGQSYEHQRDSLDDVTINERVQRYGAELETQYAVEKKQQQITQLTKEAQIQKLQNRQRLIIIGTLIIGLIIITITAIVQYRNFISKRKLAQQQQQLSIANERLRIAADMHDDVGAGLSRIRYITASLKSNNEISNADISKIVSLSDESVEKMNEIIWALNQGNQLLEELIYYTRSQCSEMVNNAGIAFTFELPENIPGKIIGWKECRNIYLLVKEAVNNALKHAAATIITLDFSFQNNFLITVTDNGKGYNAASANKEGNGLKNYEKRTAALKGTFSIESSVNGGTKVMFSFMLTPQMHT